MLLIGDYFALGLIVLVSLFYFENKYFLTRASKFFAVCLCLSATVALVDIASVLLLEIQGVPLWLNVTVNSLYFLFSALTTTTVAVYFIEKILEHVYEEPYMQVAKTVLSCALAVYIAAIVANIWTGWFFRIDESMQYHRGPLNNMGYALLGTELLLVAVYFIRFYPRISKGVKRATRQFLPIVLFCSTIRLIYPDIMLTAVILAMVETVFFLNFQNQRVGVNTLTKLNDRRRFFKDIGDRILAKDRFSAYMISVKGFSTVNRQYGHMAGDEILYLFAFGLEKVIPGSAAFHMNGMVFTLVLQKQDRAVEEENRRRLLDFIHGGVTYREEKICLECVVVEYHQEFNDTDATIIYEKLEFASEMAASERQEYIRYTSDIGYAMFRRKHLIERLNIIDREHGFELWFQPIFSVKDNQYTSMEALLRLREPDGSLISPGEFIPLAERTGLIRPITRFVIEESCKALTQYPELSDMRVSINLPMMHLLDPSFEKRLDQIVDSYGIAHDRISFEFTERIMLEDFRATRSNMERLAKSGYRFYLDDFGVGYSNFNCVLELPLRTVKLDMTITSTVEDVGERHNLVRILTDLFHGMGLQVVAEGAETEEQIELLRARGVDGIQGYYFAKPMPPTQLINFLKKKK